MRRQRYYIALNSLETRLATRAMLRFRNELLKKGTDTVDVDRIILKLHGKKRRWS